MFPASTSTTKKRRPCASVDGNGRHDRASLSGRPEHRPTANAGAQLYLELIAENVGLAIANLQLRNTLTDLAERDALSGLYNRRFLNERLEHYRKSTSENSLACLMIDIDHFKRFNDMFGHDAGDMVIQHVAQIILNTLRDRGTAFRFGGEEFTVLIPDRGEDDCYALAEELRENAGRAHLSHDGRPLGRISISIGLAISPEDGPAQTLVSRADAALLMAKAKGRNLTVRAAETGELSSGAILKGDAFLQLYVRISWKTNIYSRIPAWQALFTTQV